MWNRAKHPLTPCRIQLMKKKSKCGDTVGKGRIGLLIVMHSPKLDGEQILVGEFGGERGGGGSDLFARVEVVGRIVCFCHWVGIAVF